MCIFHLLTKPVFVKTTSKNFLLDNISIQKKFWKGTPRPDGVWLLNKVFALCLVFKSIIICGLVQGDSASIGQGLLNKLPILTN